MISRATRCHVMLSLLCVAGAASARAQSTTLTPFQQLQQQRANGAVTPMSPAQAVARANAAPAGAGALSGGPMGAGVMGAGALDGALASLKSAAMGAVKGCDYGKYIQLADNLSNYSGSFASLFAVTKRPGGWGIPATDYLGLIFNGATSAASKKTAEAQQQGLVFQLEQVCHSVAQADNMNRQFEIVKAGSMNMGNAIKFLASKLDLHLTKVNGTDKAHLTANWARLYDDVVPNQGGLQDSMYRVVSVTLKQAIDKSNQISLALDSLEVRRKQAEDELDLLAAPGADTTGGTTPTAADLAAPWKCPVGYPNLHPDVSDPAVRSRVVNGVSIPICGPVGEVRAKQINTSLMALDAQANRLKNEADITMLQVDAIRMAGDNQNRKINGFVDNHAVTHW
jgi:hypothetical protein